MRWLLAAVLSLCIVSTASAFNDHGHLVVARLAWMKLTPEQREKVVEILSKHPHYDEYLSDDKPQAVAEGEWVFLRAATWADWIKSHHTSRFSHPNWHYVNLPYVPPGDSTDPASFEVPTPNVLTQIPACVEKAKNSDDPEERAVHLCWLFHLIGDMGQPLHCTALVSEQFPDGDHGGNFLQVRVGNGTKKLHAFWDGVLGGSRQFSAIAGKAVEIDHIVQLNPELIADDVQNHTTPQQWAEEGREIAKEHAYLSGTLDFTDNREDFTPDEVPALPPGYATNAGRVARLGAAKSGARLATVLLDVVSE